MFGRKYKKRDSEIVDVGFRSGDLSVEDASSNGNVVKVIKLIYQKIKSTYGIGRNYNYETVAAPTVISQVQKAFRVEGFLSRSRNRFVELVWKNGYQVTGSNRTARKYITKRLKQISKVTNTTIDNLLDDIARYLYQYNNVFIVKERNENASGGRRRVTFFGKTLLPVAGYFVVEPSRIACLRDKDNKRIKKWIVYNQYGTEIARYSKYDVIHIRIDDEKNEVFATPAAGPILNDVKALRRMEENVEILVFQHAIPLYHYKVGTEETGARKGEVDDVESKVTDMDPSGMFVTDGRHTIECVGVRGELDVEKYLNYFRERILVGMNLSAGAIGLGDVSRSALGYITKMVLDSVARYQRIIKSHVEDFMFDELLEEGGFDSFNEDNTIELYIPEIDLDDKIRKEFHVASLWQANLYNEDEARSALGKDPFSDKDFKKTFFSRITLPKDLANRDQNGTGEGSSIGAPEAKPDPETSQKEMPKNQYGTKRRSGQPKRGTDAIIDENVLKFIDSYKNIIYTNFDSVTNQAIEYHGYNKGPIFTDLMLSGMEKVLDETKDILKEVFAYVMGSITDNEYVNSLLDRNDLVLSELYKHTNELLHDNCKIASDSCIVFDAADFKLDMLAVAMVQKAFVLAHLLKDNKQNTNVGLVFKDCVLNVHDVDDKNMNSLYPKNYNDYRNFRNLTG